MAKELASLLTNESKLVFPNGEVIEGAEQVMRFIIGTCEMSVSIYATKLKRSFIIGAAIGAGVVIVKEIVKKKQLKTKEVEA